MMTAKIAFYTFGCRLNQSETASIQNSFEANGYKIVPMEDHSKDILVINTCTVTENGDVAARRLINQMSRKNPRLKIALVGCQAQIQKEKLAHLPNVRWIVGNQRKMELVKIFEEHANPVVPQVITPVIERQAFTVPFAPVDRAHTRATIKIQDGCDFFCSFCEIPYARGRARSRVFDDIMFEAQALVDRGYQEIILAGINIGTYQYQGKTLLDVIASLEEMNGLRRIRISSIEPTTIPTEIFDFMQPGHKLCRYLHIPLQSGSDDILKTMKRKYLTAEFSDFIRLAYARVPEICIGTDVIVGFPGETAKHFAETEQFLREEPFHYIHVFSYSARRLAHSKELDDAIPALTIQARSQALRELSQRKRLLFYESLLGTEQEVIFEELKNDFWIGVTDNYVKIKMKVDEQLNRQARWVRLESLDDQAVIARNYELTTTNS